MCVLRYLSESISADWLCLARHYEVTLSPAHLQAGTLLSLINQGRPLPSEEAEPVLTPALNLRLASPQYFVLVLVIVLYKIRL